MPQRLIDKHSRAWVAWFTQQEEAGLERKLAEADFSKSALSRALLLAWLRGEIDVSISGVVLVREKAAA